jgi:hypothetical protein
MDNLVGLFYDRFEVSDAGNTTTGKLVLFIKTTYLCKLAFA